MRTFALEREQWIPRPMDEVFAFFAAAENLLPFGPLGVAVRALAVRGVLGAIFDHRFARIRALLGGEVPGVPAEDPHG